MPEWLKGTGCKPVGLAYVGSNPTPSTRSGRCGVRDISRVKARKRGETSADGSLQAEIKGSECGRKSHMKCPEAGVAQW